MFDASTLGFLFWLSVWGLGAYCIYDLLFKDDDQTLTPA